MIGDRKKTIVSWFYSENEKEFGFYPQVGGRSTDQEFKDFYLRCVCLFFASARKSHPEAQLILFSNIDLATMNSNVALATFSLLGKLDVSVQTISYDYAPPASFSRSWRNQFFLFDILNYLEQTKVPSELFVILDSDVVWNRHAGDDGLWNDLAAFGHLTYTLKMGPDVVLNGLSQTQMEALLKAPISPEASQNVPYCGGEFVAVASESLSALNAKIREVYVSLLGIHEKDPLFSFEEAHVLSMAYASLGWETGGANGYIKRIWTQPLMHRNAAADDLNLLLLHVPAEKKYGFRRLYNRFFKGGNPSKYLSLSALNHRKLISSYLGIPANSPKKWLFDVTYAFYQKVLVLSKL